MSRWITPAEVKIRFDTWFFLAPRPTDAEPRIDGEEAVDMGWFTPQGALDAYERDEILLVFPTIKTLEQLAPFDTADALLDHARGKDGRAGHAEGRRRRRDRARAAARRAGVRVGRRMPQPRGVTPGRHRRRA